jgi:predicted acylesterase/phospholipase RssA
MEFPRTSVITIQGGGAVAIDLIGQLEGLTGRSHDDSGKPTGNHALLPAAVAGTSAGALIATLYWAGYSPQAMRDEVKGLFARDRVNRFFGRGGIRWLPLPFAQFARLAKVVAAGRTGLLALLREVLLPPRRWWGWIVFPFWWAWNLLIVAYAALASVISLLVSRGIFPGDGLEAEIERLLRESPLLKPHADRLPAGTALRFYDVASLDLPQAIPLFLIVTDLRGAKEVVVSSIDKACANTPIAMAVRASAGFPGFFTPVSLTPLDSGLDCCVDGGVVSNFPAWVFGPAYRRSLRESQVPLLVALAAKPWLHVGLRLPAGSPGSPERIGGFVGRLWGLLIGRGRARLEEKLAVVAAKRRMVNPAVAADAPTGALDFDALSDEILIGSAFNRGMVAGRQAIEQGCFRLPPPEDIEVELRALVQMAEHLLKEWLVPNTRVRANVFVEELPRTAGDEPMLCLAYSAGMDNDVDRNIKFQRGQGIVWLAYEGCVSVVADLAGQRQTAQARTGQDPWLNSQGAPAILEDRTWLISMPIIDAAEMTPASRGATPPLSLDMDGPVLGVLNVDAAIDLSLPGAPAPQKAGESPAVIALFAVMQATALRCSRLLNARLVDSKG